MRGLSEDDGWVEDVRRAAGPCPRCGARDVRPVVWGLPDLDAADRLQDLVSFGGCLVPHDPPDVRCGSCGQEWHAR